MWSVLFTASEALVIKGGVIEGVDTVYRKCIGAGLGVVFSPDMPWNARKMTCGIRMGACFW
jgi:hypothetical protein